MVCCGSSRSGWGATGFKAVVSENSKCRNFVDGPMILSRNSVYLIDTAMYQVLAVKKVMLPWAPTCKTDSRKPLPENMSIMEPKDEVLPTTPISEQKGGEGAIAPAMPQPIPTT